MTKRVLLASIFLCLALFPSGTVVKAITLDGNETLTIKDTEIELTENIVMRGNSSLYLDNVTIRYRVWGNNRIDVMGEASLDIADSDIHINIELNDNAKLRAFNSRLYGEYPAPDDNEIVRGRGWLGVHDYSEVSIDNCIVGYLTSEVNTTGQVTNSIIHYTGYFSYTEIKDSKIRNYYTQLDNAPETITIQEGLDVEINAKYFPELSQHHNVTIETISFFIENSDVCIINSKIDFINLGNNTNLEIIGSDIESVSAYFCFESTLEIIESEVEVLTTYSNLTTTLSNSRLTGVYIERVDAEVSISGCKIDSLYLHENTQNPDKARIVDTLIGNLTTNQGWNTPRIIELDNVTITKGIGFEYGSGSADGGVELRGNYILGPETKIQSKGVGGYTILYRYYDFNLTLDGAPAMDADVELWNGNKTIWTGSTDEKGLVEVPVRYLDVFQLARPYIPGEPSVIQMNNMTDMLTLKWKSGRSDGEIEFGLNSNTTVPVVAYSPPSQTQYLGLILLAVIFAVMIWKRWI